MLSRSCYGRVVIIQVFFFFELRRPLKSTLFPSRRSSDLQDQGSEGVRRRLPVLRGGLRAAHLHQGQQDHRHRRERSEEHTSELQSRREIVCRLLLEKKIKWYGKAFLPLVDTGAEPDTHAQ